NSDLLDDRSSGGVPRSRCEPVGGDIPPREVANRGGSVSQVLASIILAIAPRFANWAQGRGASGHDPPPRYRGRDCYSRPHPFPPPCLPLSAAGTVVCCTTERASAARRRHSSGGVRIAANFARSQRSSSSFTVCRRSSDRSGVLRIVRRNSAVVCCGAG